METKFVASIDMRSPQNLLDQLAIIHKNPNFLFGDKIDSPGPLIRKELYSWCIETDGLHITENVSRIKVGIQVLMPYDLARRFDPSIATNHDYGKDRNRL